MGHAGVMSGVVGWLWLQLQRWQSMAMTLVNAVDRTDRLLDVVRRQLAERKIKDVDKNNNAKVFFCVLTRSVCKSVRLFVFVLRSRRETDVANTHCTAR